MHLILKTMPISTNQLHGVYRGRKILSAKGRENKESMAWEIRAQYRGMPLEGSLKAEIALWWPSKRNHDLDNIKSLLDSCTGIIWHDDGQITDLHITKGYDKENPRTEIEIFIIPSS